MSRFKNTLTLFLSSLPLLVGRSYAIQTPDTGAIKNDQTYDPVSLRPLNYASENLFASHSSHSSHASHASHASHYSGSNGGYTAPAAPTYTAPSTDPSSSSSNASAVPSYGDSTSTPPLSLAEKRKLQIMRVQIALTRLELYHGRISGELDTNTKTSLKLFQRVKGLPENGLMTTATLNGLGVMAVQ